VSMVEIYIAVEGTKQGKFKGESALRWANLSRARDMMSELT
jgi:hypothetical protein